MSQFERELANLSYLVNPKYLCSEGTISNTLKANPYMKLPVDKWEANGAKERALILRDAFVKAVEKNKKTLRKTYRNYLKNYLMRSDYFERIFFVPTFAPENFSINI